MIAHARLTSGSCRFVVLAAALGASTACGSGNSGGPDGNAAMSDAGGGTLQSDGGSGGSEVGDSAAAPGTDSGTASPATDGSPGHDSPDGDGSAEGSTGASAGALARQKVITFLGGIRGKKIAIGVEDKDSSNPHADSDTMASMSGDGQYPSFWSADWGFGGAVSERENIVQEGESEWAKGALVQFIYPACPPFEDESCEYEGGPAGTTDILNSSLTDAQWLDLTTPGGTLYKAWIGRLNTLATFFQELKTAGVAPLFRPFHEMNGSWAWWQGRPGPTGSRLLYQITHDYLVNVKGLDNIVWVWNLQDYTTLAGDVPEYNPGASDFDIAALDVYDTGYTTENYQAMLGGAGGKPIGVAECQYLPDPGTLSSQPLWTYVAMWPDFFSDDTTRIPALFSDSAVLSLSQMPGWK